MNNTYIVVAALFWAVFWIYWFINNSNQKETKQKPILSQVLPYRIFWTLSFLFLIVPKFFALDFVVLPSGFLVGLLGDFVCGAGLIVCILARKELAGNWAMQLDLKKNHELITSGPYKFVRHPIYTGFLLMFLGTAITIGMAGGLIGVILQIIGSFLRIKNEEALMTKTFGKKYLEYKSHAKTLIPFLL